MVSVWTRSPDASTRTTSWPASLKVVGVSIFLIPMEVTFQCSPSIIQIRYSLVWWYYLGHLHMMIKVNTTLKLLKIVTQTHVPRLSMMISMGNLTNCWEISTCNTNPFGRLRWKPPTRSKRCMVMVEGIGLRKPTKVLPPCRQRWINMYSWPLQTQLHITICYLKTTVYVFFWVKKQWNTAALINLFMHLMWTPIFPMFRQHLNQEWKVNRDSALKHCCLSSACLITIMQRSIIYRHHSVSMAVHSSVMRTGGVPSTR